MKHLKAFFDLADRERAEATERSLPKPRRRAPRTAVKAATVTVGAEKEKVKGTRRKSKRTKAEPARPQRLQDDSFESEWSSSRSRTRSRRRRRGRNCCPSVDSRSYSCYSDSRSVSCGPRGGRPPRGRSGPVRRRPRSAGGAVGDVSADIARFCQVNRLQPRCEKTLSELPPDMALRVMGLSSGSNTFELSGDVRDPNAVVLARIRKARDQLSSGRGGKGTNGKGFKGRGRRGRSNSRSRSRGFRGHRAARSASPKQSDLAPKDDPLQLG